MEVNTYNQYKKKTEVVQLILSSLTEPFIFHPFIVWSSIKGIVDLMRKKKSWGEMTREGFGNIQPLKSNTVNLKRSGKLANDAK